MNKLLCGLLGLALSVCGAEIRVKNCGGVNFICRDGVPLRGRMFWGGATYSQVNIKSGVQRLEFTRVADCDFDGKLTYHFRFGVKPSRLVIDDFEVTEEDTGRVVHKLCDFSGGQAEYEKLFRQWPAPKDTADYAVVSCVPSGGADDSAALSLNLSWKEGGKYQDFHIYTATSRQQLKSGGRYRVRLWVKSDVDTTLSFMGYEPPRTSGGHYTAQLSDGQYQQQVRLAAQAGVDLISPSCHLVWPDAQGRYDWHAVDSVIQSTLRVNPRALLTLRIAMGPSNSWLEKHPDDVMGWADPELHQSLRCFSVSSLTWREEACRHLGALIDHLEATFGENMAGYHPSGQNTGEWFYQDSWRNSHHGLSPVEKAAFKRWLKRRYGTDAALQAAWRRADVTLETVSTPDCAWRDKSPSLGIWLLPRQSQDVIDYNIFLQNEMTDTVLALARVIREHTRGRKLSVFFYGYGYEFSGMGRPSTTGHYDLRKLLDSPDIDILCSPISYTDRQQGGAGQAMTAAESVQLAGKVWLYEDDTATHLSRGNAPGWRDRVTTSYESRQLLVRNTAQEICRNIACWWMDLRRGGWFNDPDFWADMRQLEKMEQPLLAKPRAYQPPIASVYDERSMCYVRQGAIASRNTMYYGRAVFSRSGASYGQYLLDDLLAGKVSSPLVVLHNAWVLDAGQRARLRKVLADRFTIWEYAAGAVDPATGAVDAAEMERLCGFRLKTLPAQPMVCTVQATERGRQLGLPENWDVGTKDQLSLLLYAVEPQAGDEVLATWPDGSAAVVMHGKRGMFCGIPQLPRELLRQAAVRAGVHLYTNDDCVLFEQKPFIMVHANHDGPVNLRFEEPREVVDVMTGKTLSGRTKTFTLPLKFAETAVLELR